MTKVEVIEALKNWSENAILCAEISDGDVNIDPNTSKLKELISAGQSAGMTIDEVNEWVWTPYISGFPIA